MSPLPERERALILIVDRITPPQVLRFWSLVDRSGGSDACWTWRGARSVAGRRPVFYIGRSSSYREVSSLRVAWTLVHGADPECAILRHGCGNADCVNPAHLREGVGPEFHFSRRANKPLRPLPEPDPTPVIDPLSTGAIRARLRAGEGISAIARDLDAPIWLVGRVARGAPPPTVCPICSAANPRGVCHCNLAAFAEPLAAQEIA